MKKYAMPGSRTLHIVDQQRQPPDQTGNFIVFDIAGYTLCGMIVYGTDVTDNPTGADTFMGVAGYRALSVCKKCQKKQHGGSHQRRN